MPHYTYVYKWLPEPFESKLCKLWQITLKNLRMHLLRIKAFSILTIMPVSHLSKNFFIILLFIRKCVQLAQNYLIILFKSESNQDLYIAFYRYVSLGAGFYQMLFLHLLIWSCGFHPSFCSCSLSRLLTCRYCANLASLE